MGKVFTWEEISKKKVPRPENFGVLVRKIRQDLGACKGVIGAVLCGSVQQDTFDERSNIDLLVVYDHKLRHEVVKALREISCFALDMSIPVDLIPLDCRVVKTPLHHIGLSFAAHLKLAAENKGLIKKNPLPLFDFGTASILGDLHHYLRHKLRRFETGTVRLPFMEEAELYRFLQKILEAPVHIARKIMWWQEAGLQDDSKEAVLRRYTLTANPPELELFRKITAADREYTAELRAQLEKPDFERYGQLIERIKCLAPEALRFVRLNALDLA